MVQYSGLSEIVCFGAHSIAIIICLLRSPLVTVIVHDAVPMFQLQTESIYFANYA